MVVCSQLSDSFFLFFFCYRGYHVDSGNAFVICPVLISCIIVVLGFAELRQLYLRIERSCYYGWSWRFRKPQVQGCTVRSDLQGFLSSHLSIFPEGMGMVG